VSQILATALMLAAMQERSFVVTTAYIKTEPVQIALFVMIFLGEQITFSIAAAILIATSGVLALSWPQRSGHEIFSWRPALLGITSGGFFALAAVGFRGGIVALGRRVCSAAANARHFADIQTALQFVAAARSGSPLAVLGEAFVALDFSAFVSWFSLALASALRAASLDPHCRMISAACFSKRRSPRHYRHGSITPWDCALPAKDR
jgi:drug/metabolite transporter (DMT)-like permease